MATQAAVGIQLNEENLIRAGQRGDEQAVEALFRRYQAAVVSDGSAGAGEHEDAEDALQDGLLSAYRNLKRFEGRSQFLDVADTHRDQRGADAEAEREGASGVYRWTNRRARKSCPLRSASRTTDEPGAGIREH